MNRTLSGRLLSLALAVAVTAGMAGGIHGLAASHAAQEAQMAQTGPMPICARA